MRSINWIIYPIHNQDSLALPGSRVEIRYDYLEDKVARQSHLFLQRRSISKRSLYFKKSQGLKSSKERWYATFLRSLQRAGIQEMVNNSRVHGDSNHRFVFGIFRIAVDGYRQTEGAGPGSLEAQSIPFSFR